MAHMWISRAAVVVLIALAAHAADIPAFPGAEGFGTGTPGGRGGESSR